LLEFYWRPVGSFWYWTPLVYEVAIAACQHPVAASKTWQA
jgi:hypothetical protein